MKLRMMDGKFENLLFLLMRNLVCQHTSYQNEIDFSFKIPARTIFYKKKMSKNSKILEILKNFQTSSKKSLDISF